MQELGKIVRYHRKRAGLTQPELAMLAGIGKATVFDIEKGKATVQLSSIERVLRALNICIRLESPLMEEYEKSARIDS